MKKTWQGKAGNEGRMSGCRFLGRCVDCFDEPKITSKEPLLWVSCPNEKISRIICGWPWR